MSEKSLFRVSGKKYELKSDPAGEWKFERRPGGYIIAERKLSNGSVQRHRVMFSESKGKLGTWIAGHPLFGDVAAVSRGGAAAASSDADLVAQFPGKVRKVLVAAGDKVAEGDPLVMVEAMKMEFSVKSPRAAKVKAVLVKEGQQLSPGDRFVDLEDLLE